jgi:hypothetical protein
MRLHEPAVTRAALILKLTCLKCKCLDAQILTQQVRRLRNLYFKQYSQVIVTIKQV